MIRLDHPTEGWPKHGCVQAIDVSVVKKATSSYLVMLIDDEPAVLEALSMLLEALGYDVLAAASGAEAITMLSDSDRSPQLIISDYRLQDSEQGIDVIKAIRDAVGEEIPAMIITGDTSPSKLREAANDGLRVLHKPVTRELLTAEIARLLDT